MDNAGLRRQVPLAGAEALAILDPARGALEGPIRAEIFGAARFQQHGRSLGEAHTARLQPARAAAFFPRVRDNIRVLRQAHHYIGLQERAGHHVSPAGEWLLDNFHLVLGQVKEIHDGLPRRYFRDLPVLVDAHLAGLPRIYGVAWAFVAHTDGAFDETLLVEFLRAYQQSRELTLGELWALPTTLRVVLIENLRRLSERVAATKAALVLANLWCDQLLGAAADNDASDPAPIFNAMRARGVGRPFVLQVMQRLQADVGAASGPAPAPAARGRQAVIARVGVALAIELPDPAAAQLQQQAEDAADNLSVSNAITSLRTLADADWRALIENTSLLMQMMQASPTFRGERDDTQDSTLHAIERLARRCGKSELAVAGRLLELMRSAPVADAKGPPAPIESPSYWLRGAGCTRLRRALGVGPAALPGWPVLRQRVALPAYLAVIAAASLGLTLWLVAHAAGLATPPLGWATPALWWAALLALWPASEVVIAVVNRLIVESVPPRRLPRLALASGIPAAHRVLVVMPTLFTDTASVQSLARQLERHYLANREPHAQFALLSDLPDAAEMTPARAAADAALLACAVEAVDALEARHPPPAGAPRRFLLLHRERRWSDGEQAWIGWERKRGKLEQLIALLAAQPDALDASAAPERLVPPAPLLPVIPLAPPEAHFVDLGERSRPAANTPYVLTLDSDTGLPPGALRELVGVAAHPLNRPQVDAARRRVVGGYAILQPRIVTPLPAQGEVTPYHRLFAGQCGLDPYSAATSEVYQDLFEEGSFTGKGLLHVSALHAVLGGRLPEGLVLSHDLVEGSIARCGGVSDVTLIEDTPMHADVAASRAHRWARGDWQLWPLLLRPRRYGLRAIDRWKIVDNLRRSLVAPASVLLLIASLAGGPLSPLATLLLIAAALGGGPGLGAIAGLAPSRDDLALGHFYRQALADVGRALAGTLWNGAMLLQQALLLGNAIGTALWRMVVSRRGLLQWTTAASAQAAARSDLPGLLRRHAPVTLTAAVVLAGLLWWGSPHPLLAGAICALWAATPLWVHWGSRQTRLARAGSEPLSEPDRDYLLGVARDTWRLFEQHVGAHSQHLPPDNVQTVPHTMVAHRTSPTNIGLYLLAVACARRFGWIGTPELLARCEGTLATLALLQRHRGHFLNWTDTQTLAPLLPAYVSTVDSGNLCGHLVALATACDELAAAPAGVDVGPDADVHGHAAAAAEAHIDAAAAADQPQRLAALAAACRRLAEEAEFGFLYNPRRRLFHIGFRVAEQQLDLGYYDLLASESRLASLWAIAKGDVPVSHWAALGRPFYALAADAGLRSWSGSMFEYLMPSLVLDEPPGSALASAAHAAVHEQMAFARGHGVPWGVSECAYAALDHTLAYQYAPQGAPRLALRRTPPDEMVVAPYATALAAMFEPQAATANLRRLEGLQARAELGFIEALDYSAERQTAGSAFTPVSTFMAHHQGMTIVALANVLLGGAPRRWGMGDARLGALASLLQERVPREVSRLLEPPPAPSRADRREAVAGPSRTVVPGVSALQPTHLMSNGRYSVALRANGAGWSRFGGADISRWRDDALRDAHGSFVFLRRSATARPVSITQHPAPDPAAHYETRFDIDHLCLQANWPDLRTRCTVWVSPEDDIELRRIELWNTSPQPIRLELMSMFEVSLNDARADEAHPAFANLFVQAEWDATDRALYVARRPRLAAEAGLHAVHFVAHADQPLTAVRVQTDRARWLGRHREAAHPLADFNTAEAGAGQRATGLDPIAALSMHLTLPAHGTAFVTLATAAAASRAVLETLVDRYRQPSTIERSALMSATFASIRLREMRVGVDDRVAIQTLTTALALLLSRPEATAADAGRPPATLADTARPPATLVDGRPPAAQADSAPGFDRRSLWRFGLSGDRPLIVVSVRAVHGLRLVRSLVKALRWWSFGGLACDLVVLNSEPQSYLMPLQLELLALRDRYGTDVVGPSPGSLCGLQVIQSQDLSAPERTALRALARVNLNADGRPLAHHVQELVDWHDAAFDARLEEARTVLPAPVSVLHGPAPQGEFDAASGSFRFQVSAASRPPRPWINVLANPDFGTQVSEAGTGYTWAGNSRLHQLTAWSNDPLADAGGEAFFVQDLRGREVWSVGAGCGSAPTAYDVEHGQGWTTLRHRRGDLDVAATWCTDATRPVKQVRIVLHNRGTRLQRLRVVGVLEWMMGAQRADRLSVRTALASGPVPGDRLRRAEVLLATQDDGHAGFGGNTAFVALRCSTADGREDAMLPDWTCDRRELFDARGRRAIPDHFNERAGTGGDPCAAAAATLALGAGDSAECLFLIGHESSPAAALALALESLEQGAEDREQAVRAHWDELLGALVVRTPDPLFDALVNRWLLYQAVACRLWARAGFYQAGGAFGFRDQLQDAMALAIAAPALLRQQLLLAASRQFVEGDVQHWWHMPGGAGVRTHFSDDLLWLPWAAVHYSDVSGDTGVFDETVPFLEGEPIPAGAEDLYSVPQTSAQMASLYEHCARTLDRSLAVGAHGLPLMGTGDWNDGMNRVGAEGRGESVWLGWFLCRLVERFAPVALGRSDTLRAERWQAAATGWRNALQGVAWDGEWFVRAFFDDGSPLGSHLNAECRIDLIAQAWAVLSGAATAEQQKTAMASAMRLLADSDHGLIRLLDPPLAQAQPEAGYIQAYPPGVRENGGQYTHAGIWGLMAQAALGNADEAWRLFTWLSPAHRSAVPAQALAYGLEPYVVAADVYTQAPYVGRGGWSWYTGSAAWLHRAAVESICGLQVRADRLCVTPQLPSHWPQVELRLRRDGHVFELIVCAASAAARIEHERARGARLLRAGEWLVLTASAAAPGVRHLVIAPATTAALLPSPVSAATRPRPTDEGDGLRRWQPQPGSTVGNTPEETS